MIPTEILNPNQREKSKTYLVNKLREAVFNWREQDYPGVSNTTRNLLNFWFKEDHIVDNDLFYFWFCQREAIETLIYVYEVMKSRKFIDLAREFGQGPISTYDPSYDQYPLYAFKMATGSGKTFVMALAIVWSYFNWKFENKDDYTSKFLIISPNIIVYDRLKRDFQDLKLFKIYPFIPPQWQDEFNLKIILREDPIYTIPDEAIFLTNIQQLEERKSKKKEVEELVDEKLGLPTVSNISDIAQSNRIREILTRCPNIMILKDEAHHIYNFEKAWKKILLNLHKNLISDYGKGINIELDFSATPKTETGSYFPWIISDFTLKEAIQMNIVKLPLKGIVQKASEVSSFRASERYKAWIDAGIRRFREYKEKLQKLEKKPVLFIMCEDTEQADDVFEYINSIPDLKYKVLLVHTNLKGEIVQKDLDEARKAARLIDEPDNPYDVIVSVMMLNEGWDVKSVVTIVGLRSYTSKRKILPEQVIGRGLRKLFPEEPANPEKNINVLEVIGPPGLLQILEELEKQEGIKFGEFNAETKIELTTIFVDENKLDKNIKIPVISPRINLKEPLLEELDFEKLPAGNIKLENKVLETEYVAKRMDTDVEVIRKKWDLPIPQDSRSVIAYYTQKILKELKIPVTTNFERFYPLVKNYVCKKLFDKKVDLDDPRVLYNLSQVYIEEFLIKIFVETFKDLTFKETEPSEEKKMIELSETKPFVWSKQVYPANKCIFNYVPCDNTFEVSFARFLDGADDVFAFTKIVPKIGFFIEYLDKDKNLRLYYPDFIVKTIEEEFILIETKGIVDENVIFKDRRTKIWCEDVTKLTGKKWKFIRINQKDFEKYHRNNLNELIKTIR